MENLKIKLDDKEVELYDFDTLYQQYEENAFADGETFMENWDFNQEQWSDDGEFILEAIDENYFSIIPNKDLEDNIFVSVDDVNEEELKKIYQEYLKINTTKNGLKKH